MSSKATEKHLSMARRAWKGSVRHMCAQRAFLRGSLLEYLLVFILFTVLTILYTNFIAFHITTQLFATTGDATAGFLWLNFADPNLSPFLSHTDYVNYPFGEQLGGPSFITYTALWLPLRFLSFFFGPVAGLNLTMFGGFIGAALSMYWLMKRLTGSVSVSLFAGFATAFVPYALYNSSAHLAYIFSIVFIFMLASFIALWSRPTKLRALLFSLSIAFAFYTDGYYLLLGSVMVVGLSVSGVVYGLLTRFTWRDYTKRLKALLLSAALLVVFIFPIAYVQVTQGGQVQKTLDSNRSNIEGEIKEYRAKIIDFIIPAENNPFFSGNQDLASVHATRNTSSNTGESTNYIGFTILVLMAGGSVLMFVWLFLRKRSSLNTIEKGTVRRFMLVGTIGLVTIPLFLAFMLSPEIHVLGHTIPLPGRFMIEHNIALWRVMSRFFVPLHVIMVLFAGLSLWLTLTSYKLMGTIKKQRNIIGALVVALLTIILAFEYATTIYRPSFDFTKIAPGYLWLRDQKDISVIAELSAVDPLDGRAGQYVTAQIVHRKKLVNFKEPSDKRLTNTLGSLDNPETIDWAYQRGAQVVVVHDAMCDPVGWGVSIYKDENDPKNRMCIYRIDRPATPDKLFIRFGQGFNPSPNQKDQSSVVLSKGTATMDVTDDSFEQAGKGSAQLTTQLAGLEGSRWSMKQEDKVVGSGVIEGDSIAIDITIDATKPIILHIDRPDSQVVKLGEFTLIRSKVTSL